MSAAGGMGPGSLLGEWGLPPDEAAWGACTMGTLLVFGALAAGFGARLVAVAPGARGWTAFQPLRRIRARPVTWCLAATAALLSLGYVATYLRGGPRIIDATSYFLQGRALSQGHVAWTIPVPSASFRGRFLLSPDGTSIAGIFPPGYPLLLSAGFLLGAPLIVGPLVALGLVLVTGALGSEVWKCLHTTRATAKTGERLSPTHVGVLASAMSTVCGTLRYHTADTMSHGALGLAMAGACLAALRAERDTDGASRRERLAHWAIAGALGGWALSTRIVSGAVLLGVIALLASCAQASRPSRALGVAMLGALPGMTMLLAAQRAATGALFETTQLAYYAASDGPPGCFGLGFGANVGCRFEHGDVVERDIKGGFGVVEAVLITGRRLIRHAGDALNLGLLFPVVMAGSWACVSHAKRTYITKDGGTSECARGHDDGRTNFDIDSARSGALKTVAISVLVVAHVLSLVPFYFDGSYPGGGARLYAEVLPLEHVLAAVGVAWLTGAAPRGPNGSVQARFLRLSSATLGVALLGFGFHQVFEHRALAARDGGRPYFEPDALVAAGIERGLVFMDSDHGFNLAYDPAVWDRTPPEAPRGVHVARHRGDDRDRLLHEALGHPEAFVYRFTAQGPQLDLWRPRGTDPTEFVFEAEAEWPPLGQRGGWAAPAAVPCASGGGALRFFPWQSTTSVDVDAGSGNEAGMDVELPVPEGTRDWRVTPRIVAPPPAGDPHPAPKRVRIELWSPRRDRDAPQAPFSARPSELLALWTWPPLPDDSPAATPAPLSPPHPCVRLETKPVQFADRHARVRVRIEAVAPPSKRREGSRDSTTARQEIFALDAFILHR